MVGVFARLKLRTLFNIARSGKWPVLAVLAIVMIGGFGVGFAWLVRFVIERVDGDPVVVGIIYSAVALIWIVGPIVMASIDQTLEPRSFENYPLTRHQMAAGLTVAGMISPGSAFTLLLVGGVAAGQTDALGWGWAAAGAWVAAVLVWALCLLEARFLTTFLSDMLRWRRGREIVSLAALMLLVLPSLVPVTFVDSANPDFGWVSRVVRWNPFGALGGVGASLMEGDWISSIGVLSLGLALSAGMVSGFGWALGRLSIQTGDTTPVQRLKSTGLGFGSSRLMSGPVGAVTAKELKYLRRDLRVKGQLLASVIIIVGLAYSALTGQLGSWAPMTVSAVSFALLAPLMFNTFGLDGGSFWMYVLSGVRGRQVLAGKIVAYLLAATPVLLVVTGLLAWSGRSISYLGAGFLTAMATSGLFVGVGAVVAVYAAYQLPEENLFATRTAGQFRVMLFGLGGFFVTGLALLPMAVGLLVGWAIGGVGGVTLAALVAVIYGGGVLALGLWAGGSLFDERAMRLIEILDAE
ncbi:MAG: hypothetical protein JJE47_15880 [Acidimicrobiia bacterium]|nr:hypothetical protein [Acidimicrobiia bacterium]